ncbi:hypothetical protein M6B38_323355 [Iris pallida]|uniref:Uncharacterized protein n=1 Tax=Iris pallida TaxID=29817 RepID=A0AAX6H9J2_IRIPA|nr:hypothetical protein M6B38_323355 [Iris pallida]
MPATVTETTRRQRRVEHDRQPRTVPSTATTTRRAPQAAMK